MESDWKPLRDVCSRASSWGSDSWVSWCVSYESEIADDRELGGVVWLYYEANTRFNAPNIDLVADAFRCTGALCWCDESKCVTDVLVPTIGSLGVKVRLDFDVLACSSR